MGFKRLAIFQEGRFEKDVEKSIKRGKDMKKLWDLITLLAKDKKLPIKYREHKLKGNYKDYWECHVEPDWLLVYKKLQLKLYL